MGWAAAIRATRKITGAGNLPARYVIHAVGPVWQGGGAGEAELLAGAHRRAIELAERHEAKLVAFPAISTGAFGYPLEQAARVSLSATAAALAAHPAVEEARFWLFDQRSYEVFAATQEQLASAP